MFTAVRRIEVPTGPAPDATLSHRRSPSASEHAVAERLTVAVLASSWGDRPGGGKFWAMFRRKQFVWRPETKIRDAATTHRPSVRVYRMPVAGTSAGIGSFSTMLQLCATRCNCLQAWKMTHSRGWVESEPLARIAAAREPEMSRIACWIRALADLQHLFRRRTD